MQRWARRLSFHSCSRTFRAAKTTQLSLSTEVAGYGFGEWLHVCRLQAPFPALEAKFRPERLLVRWPFRCRKIVTYHIASSERLEFIRWISRTVIRIFSCNVQRLDHLKTDGRDLFFAALGGSICLCDPCTWSHFNVLSVGVMLMRWWCLSKTTFNFNTLMARYNSLEV